MKVRVHFEKIERGEVNRPLKYYLFSVNLYINSALCQSSRVSISCTLQDGIIQHSSTFDGVHYADANRNSFIVGPITISGTLNVEGNLFVTDEINITGTLDIKGDGELTVN